MPTINYSNARQNFKSLIDQVNEDKVAITITTKDEDNDAVLISQNEYSAMLETIHLLQSPKNARRLQESIDQLHSNEVVQMDIDKIDD